MMASSVFGSVIPRQEGKPAVARKSQFVRVSRLVEILTVASHRGARLGPSSRSFIDAVCAPMILTFATAKKRPSHPAG